jgi:hypothetical protein
MRQAILRSVMGRGIAVTALATALAVVGATGPAMADSPRSDPGIAGVCETASSGYYCLWQHKFFGGTVWIENRCFNNQRTAIPSAYRDMASAWMHRQYSGAWVTVYNYEGGGVYRTLWEMRGSNSEDNLVDGADNDKADTILNHC